MDGGVFENLVATVNAIIMAHMLGRVENGQ